LDLKIIRAGVETINQRKNVWNQRFLLLKMLCQIIMWQLKKNDSMIFQEAGNGKLFAAGKHKLQNFILTISAFQS